jgi:cell division protein FtsL
MTSSRSALVAPPTANRAAAAPARPGRPLRPPSAPAEPSLRLVPRRRRRTRAVVTLTTIVVFVVLFATAAVHTTIVSGQRDLDRIASRIETGERRNQTLRLRVAELESPGRVVDAATADGMEVPDEVTWLTPQPDGGTEASTAPRAGAPEATGGAATEDEGVDEDVTDERAGSDPTDADGDGADGSAG